eukprot:3573950-Prymnesium_polylepis.2
MGGLKDKNNKTEPKWCHPTPSDITQERGPERGKASRSHLALSGRVKAFCFCPSLERPSQIG